MTTYGQHASCQHPGPVGVLASAIKHMTAENGYEHHFVLATKTPESEEWEIQRCQSGDEDSD